MRKRQDCFVSSTPPSFVPSSLLPLLTLLVKAMGSFVPPNKVFLTIAAKGTPTREPARSCAVVSRTYGKKGGRERERERAAVEQLDSMDDALPPSPPLFLPTYLLHPLVQERHPYHAFHVLVPGCHLIR